MKSPIMTQSIIPSRFLRGVSVCALACALCASLVSAQLVINEVDSDTPGTDTLEFVELYDGGVGNTSLEGYVIVFYNGSNDQSYAAYDLDSYSTDANGFFVLGNSGVTGAQITFADNFLQNGADAVALYSGNAADFPNGTAVTLTNLVDAIVYDTADADDSGLLDGLGQDVQYDESANGDKDNQSIARVPDGGTIILTQAATPGTTNDGGGGDETDPILLVLSPADDATQAFVDADLAISFNEAIQAGATGTISIKTTLGGAEVETITLPSAKVTTSGSIALINPDTILTPGISYYVEITAGTFTDLADNPAAAISGSTAWNFTTRSTGPEVVISQYYEGEGASQDRFIELKNLTGGPLLLSDYKLAAWSDTAPSDNEGWKSGVNTADRVTDLSLLTIPANGFLLITETDAVAPDYAVANNDLLDDGGCTAIDGDDSVVLYKGNGFTTDRIVDAVSISGSEGTDTSFYRLADDTGFDFTPGNSISNYPAVWGIKSISDVDGAAPADPWYLSASQPINTFTFTIDPSSISEAAGTSAATATVTRNGDTTDPLLVNIATSGSKASTALPFLEISAGESSADFIIDAIDDPWLTGDITVTFTISAPGYLPASEQLIVFDQESDVPFPVVINEVDADQVGTDAAEFIELYNKSGVPVSLGGLVLVLYNGSNDLSYSTIDLSGKTIPANGFFVVGNAAVTSALVGVDSITVSDNSIQNGADAVALYIGSAANFPDGVSATQQNGTLVDALVYGTNDPDDAELLAALLPVGKPQIDEDLNASSANESMSRLPDGGEAFDTGLFVVQVPTPGATNLLPDDNFSTWIAGFDFSAYPGADLSPNGDADNDGLANSVENILGTSPAAASQGLVNVTVGAGTLSFQHTLSAAPASDLAVSYEWSLDLATWNSSGASAGGTTVSFGVPVVVTPGPPDLVEVTATVTGSTPARVFSRIKVVGPPAP